MKGIILRPDQLEAILDNPDREWQTRWLHNLKEINQSPGEWHLSDWKYPMTPQFAKGAFLFGRYPDNTQDGSYRVIKPHYRVGEVVYAKEAFATMAIFDDRPPRDLDMGTPIWFSDTPPDEPTSCGDDIGKWRSPLFMPARAARTFIQITGVKAELFRLEKLTSQDIEAEGREEALVLLREYEGLWVWVYQFKKVSKPVEGMG